MEWTHLKPAAARRMPWKNGGGSTLELAVEPSGATLETGFHWRASMAEVGISGPFSAFPGLERWLMLLEGAGFRIDFGSQGCVELREPLKPIKFPGDWPAVATLVDGPCVDFNLMVDSRKCEAQVVAFSLTTPRRLPLSPATTLVFLARGSITLPELNLQLGPRHALRVDGGVGELEVVPGQGGAWLVVAGIR